MKYFDYSASITVGNDGSMLVNGKILTPVEVEAVYQTVKEQKNSENSNA